MPVPEPNSYSYSQSELYQLLLQMNQKLDKLALAVQTTNSVLQTWPSMTKQSTVKPQHETQAQAGSSPESAGGTCAEQKQDPKAAETVQSVQNSPHGSEEPLMVTTPQGVTIVRF